MVRGGERDVEEPDCASCFVAVEVWIVVVKVGEDCGDDKGDAFAVGSGASFEVNAKGLVWMELE